MSEISANRQLPPREVASCLLPVASEEGFFAFTGNWQLATGCGFLACTGNWQPATGNLSRARKGFTLIEMLTTVAVLIIVLGLMVSLARYVRDASAQAVSKALLRQLDHLMAQYAKN